MGKCFDFRSGVNEMDKSVLDIFLQIHVGDGEGSWAWLDAWAYIDAGDEDGNMLGNVMKVMDSITPLVFIAFIGPSDSVRGI